MKFLFLFIVLPTYSLVHLYFWHRLKTIFSMNRVKSWTVLALLLFLNFSLLLSRTFSHLGWLSVGQYLHWLGSIWLGFVFVLFGVESLLLMIAALQKLSHGRCGSPSWRRRPGVLVVSASLAVLINIYGFFEAGQLQTTRLAMTSPSMEEGSTPIKILQISDTHYGLLVLPFRHERLLERVRQENPDLLVATGDIVDFWGWPHDVYMDQWRAIQPPYGKFVVPGNHETMVGLPQSQARLQRGGFRMLRNELVEFNGFSLLGIDDPSTHQWNPNVMTKINFSRQKGGRLLLHHQPVWPVELSGSFDLGLSGHTHGGQIFPFGLAVYLTNGVLSGLHPTPWGGWNFISRGAGTWGAPVRVLAPPEITLLTIRPGVETKVAIQSGDP
ncbi:MAG TPA: metallophosphoesterase [Magnetococcales bacterium]|nr:metallophosphoesterase [Magnetococcales bacterium]